MAVRVRFPSEAQIPLGFPRGILVSHQLPQKGNGAKKRNDPLKVVPYDIDDKLM